MQGQMLSPPDNRRTAKKLSLREHSDAAIRIPSPAPHFPAMHP